MFILSDSLSHTHTLSPTVSSFDIIAITISPYHHHHLPTGGYQHWSSSRPYRPWRRPSPHRMGRRRSSSTPDASSRGGASGTTGRSSKSRFFQVGLFDDSPPSSSLIPPLFILYSFPLPPTPRHPLPLFPPFPPPSTPTHLPPLFPPLPPPFSIFSPRERDFQALLPELWTLDKNDPRNEYLLFLKSRGPSKGGKNHRYHYQCHCRYLCHCHILMHSST